MKFLSTAAIISIVCACAGVAAGTATKSTASKKTSKSPTSKSSTSKTGAKKKAGAKSGKSKSTKNTVPAATWRNRQQNPSADRYKEIQQALVDKGYLKGEPTGVWDTDSSAALQKFQMDQKLQATGKINAPSLIGLGLGAKSAGAPEAAPLAPPPDKGSQIEQAAPAPPPQ